MDKKQIIFIVFVFIFLTYFVTGFLVFLYNGYGLMDVLQNYSLGFTYTALVNKYPKLYESLSISAATSTILALGLVVLARPQQSLYGDARFASFGEVKNKIGLLGEAGLIVGKIKNKFLRFDSLEFVSLGAPTRSGKGVSIVIPNLLEWKNSVVVLDIKKECFDITSKYRKDILKQEVYLFDPFNIETHCYNPLSYIDMKNENTRDNDLLDFVNLLYPLIGSDTSIFFNLHAQNLFIGLCYLYNDLTSTKKGRSFLKEHDLNVEFTMYGILTLSQGFKIAVNSFEHDDASEDNEINGFDDTIEYLIFLDILSKNTKERLKSYMNIASANTKSGVESSFSAPLFIYRGNTIRKATKKSDFDFNDLRKKKMTIYLGISPDKLAQAQPILN
ncbi:MAG: type IV secretory system conjugative DNA transfer family protein, partial [Sulfurimonas sp.]|uniref:type IV secretory system conjugative DNA transfer family protein n=1 Tax=Sulfurimonas sp. TaxID=2022749 RepID=UPI003561A332